MKRILIPALALLLAASFVLNGYVHAQTGKMQKSYFDRVIIGKTRKQVRTLLGAPSRVEGNGSYWIYTKPRIIDDQTGEPVGITSIDWTLRSEGKVKSVSYR